jgi:hypothetical protein
MLTMAPAPLAFRYPRAGPSRQEGTIQDHAQHGVPIGEAHLIERLFRAARSVVDEDVQAPEPHR